MLRGDATCVRVDGSWRGDSSRASTRKIRGGGGSGRLPVLACYTGGPRRLSPPGAEMTAGENRREVGCLSRMSGFLDCCYVGERRQGGGATQTCPSMVRRSNHASAEPSGRIRHTPRVARPIGRKNRSR